jgi:hypothetical protein
VDWQLAVAVARVFLSEMGLCLSAVGTEERLRENSLWPHTSSAELRNRSTQCGYRL